jgi:hypothetical protein
MAKRKVTLKKIKTVSAKGKKTSYGGYAVEHDFIIIAGGGLIVLMLTCFFLFLQ